MLYESNSNIFSTLDVLIVILPMLLGVAFMTLKERKQLASLMRRVGPNTTGFLGLQINS
jgi:NADH-ubiquinone oxidoreductase chain 1